MHNATGPSSSAAHGSLDDSDVGDDDAEEDEEDGEEHPLQKASTATLQGLLQYMVTN